MILLFKHLHRAVLILLPNDLQVSILVTEWTNVLKKSRFQLVHRIFSLKLLSYESGLRTLSLRIENFLAQPLTQRNIWLLLVH